MQSSIKSFLITLGIAISLSNSTPVKASEESPIKVLREQCLTFPKVPELTDATRGVDFDYEIKQISWGLCENYSPNCPYYLPLNIHYHYREVKKYDIYSHTGRLITTAIETQRYALEGTASHDLDFGSNPNWPGWSFDQVSGWAVPELGNLQSQKILSDTYTQSVQALVIEIKKKLSGYNGEACSDSDYK